MLYLILYAFVSADSNHPYLSRASWAVSGRPCWHPGHVSSLRAVTALTQLHVPLQNERTWPLLSAPLLQKQVSVLPLYIMLLNIYKKGVLFRVGMENVLFWVGWRFIFQSPFPLHWKSPGSMWDLVKWHQQLPPKCHLSERKVVTYPGETAWAKRKTLDLGAPSMAPGGLGRGGNCGSHFAVSPWLGCGTQVFNQTLI